MAAEKRNWFDEFALYMDRNIRGVQYGIYSVAFIGLAIAFRSVRPLKKFTTPKEIPSSFVQKHIILNGKVVGLGSSSGSPILLVDHLPVIELWQKQNGNKLLPVQVSSIDVRPLGISWLQTVVVGSNVNFQLLKITPQAVNCIVITSKNKNVGLELVSLGFASVAEYDFELDGDPLYLKYYRRLLTAEYEAEKKGVGMWANGKTAANSWWLSMPVLWSKVKAVTHDRNKTTVAKGKTADNSWWLSTPVLWHKVKTVSHDRNKTAETRASKLSNV